MMRVTNRQARAFIERRVEFRNSTGSLRGVTRPHSHPGSRLPSEYADGLSGSPYVVYSYATPIAWVHAETGAWVRPAVKYSPTTSCHQGACPVDGDPR